MRDCVSVQFGVHFGTWDETNSKMDLPFSRSQLTDMLRDWFPQMLQLSADRRGNTRITKEAGLDYLRLRGNSVTHSKQFNKTEQMKNLMD